MRCAHVEDVVDSAPDLCSALAVALGEVGLPAHDVGAVRKMIGEGQLVLVERAVSRAGGAPVRYDGSGQVIAILDTGIEHAHPAFDTRFGDGAFEQRTGDVRPVRTAGQPYQEGVHHPKVVYFLSLTVLSLFLATQIDESRRWR